MKWPANRSQEVIPEKSTSARSGGATVDNLLIEAILRFCWPANRSRSDSVAQKNGTSKRLRTATFAARRLVEMPGVEPGSNVYAAGQYDHVLLDSLHSSEKNRESVKRVDA